MSHGRIRHENHTNHESYDDSEIVIEAWTGLHVFYRLHWMLVQSRN